MWTGFFRGSAEGPVLGSCEHGNEYSRSINWAAVSLCRPPNSSSYSAIVTVSPKLSYELRVDLSLYQSLYSLIVECWLLYITFPSSPIQPRGEPTKKLLQWISLRYVAS
jgi:hypothetical protein